MTFWDNIAVMIFLLLCGILWAKIHKASKKEKRALAIAKLTIAKGDLVPPPRMGETVLLRNLDLEQETWRSVRHDHSLEDRAKVLGQVGLNYLLEYLPSNIKDNPPITFVKLDRCTNQLQAGDLYMASREDIFDAYQRHKKESAIQALQVASNKRYQEQQQGNRDAIAKILQR